jgi:hypothetical protein
MMYSLFLENCPLPGCSLSIRRGIFFSAVSSLEEILCEKDKLFPGRSEPDPVRDNRNTSETINMYAGERCI